MFIFVGSCDPRRYGAATSTLIGDEYEAAAASQGDFEDFVSFSCPLCKRVSKLSGVQIRKLGLVPVPIGVTVHKPERINTMCDKCKQEISLLKGFVDWTKFPLARRHRAGNY